MIIETERLILRKYTKRDHNALSKIITDPITMKYYPKPYDEEGVDKWIAWCADSYKKNGFGLWAVVLKENKKFIGDCGISLQNIDSEELPEIGYHINIDYQRQGYAKEAGKAVRDWAFNNTNYDTLYSYMTARNIPSQLTARSIGLKRIKEYKNKDGVIDFVYAISRDTWEKIKGE